MSFRGKIGKIVETSRNEKELYFEWQIPYFFSPTSERGNRFVSPFFHFRNALWSLAVHPNGIVQYPSSEIVGLFLFRDDKGLPKTLNITVGISGVKGVEHKKEKGQEFSINDPACCWYSFIMLAELREHQSRLVPDGMLKIACNMKSVVFPAAREASSQTDGIVSEAEVLTEESKSAEKLGIEKLSKDIAKLLVIEENSDATVQVGDVEFGVHRSILSVRSPVLSAMFKRKTEESASNRIIMEEQNHNCEPKVFRDFLGYLYAGSVRSLTEQNVFGLYKIADKYLADDLKLQCLKHIRDSLCVPTFCNAVKLALVHVEDDLLKLALDFATENIQSILISVEWQNFICQYPREANEILVKCFVPRS